jgi:hypothetical protein
MKLTLSLVLIINSALPLPFSRDPSQPTARFTCTPYASPFDSPQSNKAKPLILGRASAHSNLEQRSR